jgi:hypothetical protein
MPVVAEQVAPFDRFDVVTGNADNPLDRFRGHEEELPTCLDQQTVKGRNRGGKEHTYHRPCPSACLQVDLAPQTLDPLLDDGQPQATSRDVRDDGTRTETGAIDEVQSGGICQGRCRCSAQDARAHCLRPDLG